MNKEQLVSEIAASASITKSDAARVVDVIVKAVQAALRRGEEVTLLGFGSFRVRERPERQGRNPSTGAAITMPASRLPVFKAGKALRDAVR